MTVATETKRGRNPEMMRMMASTGATHFCWTDESDAALLIFGGMPITDTAWVPFQFVQSTLSMPVNKVYLRDMHRSWYHHGLRPDGVAIDDSAAFLMENLIAQGVKRIVCIGSSAGGYAAMLFGHLINADEVHAFAPRTYVDVDNRLKYDDFYMDQYVENLYGYELAQKEYFDLRTVFEARDNGRTNYFIHYTREIRNDCVNADHLLGVSRVYRHEYQEGAHRIARALRDNGHLDTLLDTALHGETPAEDKVYDF